MVPAISAVADTILPGTKLVAIIYACIFGTIAIDAERIGKLIHQSRPGVSITNPVTAAMAAFKRFNAPRISILTPYSETVNLEVAGFARLLIEHSVDN